jgi:YHS domain-containing protein
MKRLGAVMVLLLVGIAATGYAGGACCPGKSVDAKACAPGAKAQVLAQEEGAAVAPAAETVKAQETCPVMGAPVNKKYYSDHNGKRVYFCCGACPSMFNADPEKYMKKLAEEGVALEDTPAAKE